MERLRERKGKFTFKLEFVLPLSTSQIVLLRHFVRNAEGKMNPNQNYKVLIQSAKRKLVLFYSLVLRV